MGPDEEETLEQEDDQEDEQDGENVFTDEDEEDLVEEETEEQAEEEAEEAPAPVTPSFSPSGEDPDMALLRENFGDDVVGAMNRILAKHQESASLASLHVSQAASDNPELFRVYGPRINQAVAQLDPSLRAQPDGVNIAIATIFMEEAKAKGIGPALQRLASMSGAGAKPAAKPAAKPKAPIPPEQRPPSPGNGRASESTASPRERRIRYYMKETGLEREEVEAALSTGRL